MINFDTHKRKVTLSEGKNHIAICFLPDKKEDTLKSVLMLMKKKVTSYQELNYLSQAFGVNLSTEEKRNAVNTRIKDMML